MSGTDEPLSVGSDEPHFSMQFDINLNYKLYEYVSEVTSGRTYYEVMTKVIQIMMCLDFLCYMCLGRDHGPMDPNGWLKHPVPLGPMNHHGCC